MRRMIALIAVLNGCGGETAPPAQGPAAELHGVVITARDVIVDGVVFAVAPGELEAGLADRLRAQGAHVPLAFTPDAAADTVLAALRGIAQVPERDAAIFTLAGDRATELCRPVRPPPPDDRLVLSIRVLPGQATLSVLGTNDAHTRDFRRLDDVVVLLRDELLPGRTDALLAAAPGATGADLTHAIAALCHAGFTAVRPVADLAAFARPEVLIGQPNAQGDLPKADIRKEVRQHLPAIRGCYLRGLETKPNLAGTVQIQFVIAGTGLVVQALGSGVDPGVATCVADVVKQLEFPHPRGGGIVQVNFPFTLRRGEPP